MLRHAPPLLDLVGDLLRAKNGDADARQRALRRGAPLAADLLRPGAGLFVSKGVELWDQWRAYDAAQHGLPDGDEDAGEPGVHPMDRFVRRLLSKRFNFLVAVGEPGSGKTTLLLKLAQRLAQEHGYAVSAVGGLHPDDRKKWHTEDWIDSEHPASFIEAMQSIDDANIENMDYPRDLKRRVVLIDDASLRAHVGAVRFNRALEQAWNNYRHLDWWILLSARRFKSIATVAEDADVVCIKRPDWENLNRERDEAREWWEEADRAYADMKARQDENWQADPHEQHWVYVRATDKLKYKGMLRYGPPAIGALD